MTLHRVKMTTGRALVVTASTLLALTGAATLALAAAPGDPVAQAAAPPSFDQLGEWAEATSDRVDIGERALFAYGAADLALQESRPGCNLRWNTLAAIGQVESAHGRFGGARVGDDGRAEPEIRGIPLDGRPGVKRIEDTDDGVLDGDTEFDRAVGPMQFIPTTWEVFGIDADGDGVADPHDIDDATLAAGRYLCSRDRDLADGDDWWAALYSYNRSVTYGNTVHAIAASLADRTA